MKKNVKHWVLFAVGIFGSGALLASVVYIMFPQALLRLVELRYESNAGVVEKSLIIDGEITTYYEGGKGTPLVLLHGFGDSKISFLRTTKWLSPHFRVILPEIAGFGKSAHNPKKKYSISAQVARLHKLVKKIGLKTFVLGGNSMGGHISAAYALAYPKQVRKLILLNAAGLTAKNALPPYKLGGKKVENIADFEVFLRRLFYKIPPIPRVVKLYLAKKAKENHDWNARIARDIRTGKDYILNQRISKMTVPTLILWGDHDRLVLLPIGRLYHAKIKDSVWVLMKRCGHLPQNERPKETAEHILTFLQ